MLNFILGLIAGLIVGLAIYIFKTRGPSDGVMTFDPLGEEIVGLSLNHDLYSLSKKKELRILVTSRNVKEAIDEHYLEDRKEDRKTD